MEEKTSRILITDDNKDIHDDIKYLLSSSQSILEKLETVTLKNELFGDEPNIEDHKKIEFSVKNSFKYKIEDAYQGEESITMVQKAKSEGYPYSLIFMDVRMPPGIDGITTVERIWKIDPHVEVVICTAYSDYSWDQILLELGQSDHLLIIKKPFDSLSLKQITLSLVTKWHLQMMRKNYVENLEFEVEKRTLELKSMVKKLQEEIQLRKEKERQLEYYAHYDSLMGLLSRHSFYEFISGLKCGSIEISRFSVFYIDIDNFKQVNDTYGHDIGDLLLVEVSKRLKRCLSLTACQIPGNIINVQTTPVESIFRMGGDEFTVFVDASDRNTASELANNIIAHMKKPFYLSSQEVYISCSIGIGVFPEDSDDVDTLLKYADISLYKAKESKNSFVFFEDIKNTLYLHSLHLEKDLDKALEKNQIELYYQSFINTEGRIIGIEALARWIHPVYGVLNPSQFIHIAEKSHLIHKIGEFILQVACKRLKELHTNGYHDLFVLVNFTSKQFYDKDFIDHIKKAIHEVKLEPKYLKIGMVEKFSLQNIEASLSVISRLTELGIQFTINGFGGTNSMLTFLQQIPQGNMVMIDKKYVETITKSTDDQDFLLHMMELIKSRNLNVIVSGIETPEQKNVFNDLDCILQGYYFSVPQPFEEFIKEIENHKKTE